MRETIIELGFWLHDNWLPGVLVAALAILLLRLIIVGRRSRHWTFPETKGKAAGGATAGIAGAAAGAGLAADAPPMPDHASGGHHPHDGGHAHHDSGSADSGAGSSHH